MELYTGFVTSSCYGDKQVFEMFLLEKDLQVIFCSFFQYIVFNMQNIRLSRFSKLTARSNIATSTIVTQKLAIS
jgi:hypothetical protein